MRDIADGIAWYHTGINHSAGDHVLPNVGLILDKSVFLLESLPKSDQ